MAYPDRHKGWAIVYVLCMVPLVLLGAIGFLGRMWGEWTYDHVTRWLDMLQAKMWRDDV